MIGIGESFGMGSIDYTIGVVMDSISELTIPLDIDRVLCADNVMILKAN